MNVEFFIGILNWDFVALKTLNNPWKNSKGIRALRTWWKRLKFGRRPRKVQWSMSTALFMINCIVKNRDKEILIKWFYFTVNKASPWLSTFRQPIFWKLKKIFDHTFGIFHDLLYNKNVTNWICIFFNFDFLWYFWHEDLFKVFMPKVPQKDKILKNKKNKIFKTAAGWRRWSTLTSAVFLVDCRMTLPAFYTYHRESS